MVKKKGRQIDSDKEDEGDRRGGTWQRKVV
jgi:hypothetical protein